MLQLSPGLLDGRRVQDLFSDLVEQAGKGWGRLKDLTHSVQLSQGIWDCRRVIHCALVAGRHLGNQMIFIALDWARAFDSISLQALQRALLRFGGSTTFANVVQSIYQNRTFVVWDGHETSEPGRSSMASLRDACCPPFFSQSS